MVIVTNINKTFLEIVEFRKESKTQSTTHYIKMNEYKDICLSLICRFSEMKINVTKDQTLIPKSLQSEDYNDKWVILTING